MRKATTATAGVTSRAASSTSGASSHGAMANVSSSKASNGVWPSNLLQPGLIDIGNESQDREWVVVFLGVLLVVR